MQKQELRLEIKNDGNRESVYIFDYIVTLPFVYLCVMLIDEDEEIHIVQAKTKLYKLKHLGFIKKFLSKLFDLYFKPHHIITPHSDDFKRWAIRKNVNSLDYHEDYDAEIKTNLQNLQKFKKYIPLYKEGK